jgi:trehalose 6-phosphate phosphatase
MIISRFRSLLGDLYDGGSGEARRISDLDQMPNSTGGAAGPGAAAAPGSGQYCLFLDVDGTLVEFASTPDGVHVDEPLAGLIEQGSRALGGALALVSGRSIADLDRLFAPFRWPAAGLHGLERRNAEGYTHAPVRDLEQLATARAMLNAIAGQHHGVIVEDKGASLAVHFRQAPHLEGSLTWMLEQLVRDLGSDFHLQPGACVLELKLRGPTKADAIHAFLSEQPFAGRTPVFAGDDLTDLDGFAAVENAGGLSISVGDRVRGRMRLASPAALRDFLADLIRGNAP